jgi:zinc transport system permease protein
MYLDFVERAVIAGVGIALVAGPLGSVIVWRRMANFGDALAHSTLLGLCLAVLLNIHLYIGLTSVCILVACLLALCSQKRELANDTLLSMLAYTTLAIGLTLATILKGVRIDLLSYLYGDILAVDKVDIIWIYSVAVIAIFVLIMIWRFVLSMIVHEDLARVEGTPVALTQWILIIMTAIVFAVAMKLVGILLMTALLIIPASAARQIARTPEQMAIFASFLGMVAVFLGIIASGYWDWPAGPAIVMASMLIFLLILAVNWLIRRPVV